MIAYSAKNVSMQMNGFDIPVKSCEVTVGDIEWDDTNLVDSRSLTAEVALERYDTADFGVLFGSGVRQTITLTMMVPNPTNAHRFKRHPRNRRWRRRDAYYRKTANPTTWAFPNAVVTKTLNNGAEFTVSPPIETIPS